MKMFGSFVPNEFKPLHGGKQYIFKFDNGYGASVIQHSFSYGRGRGLWELAVLDKDGELCYSTDITNDVLGGLSEEMVADTLKDIKNLQKEE